MTAFPFPVDRYVYKTVGGRPLALLTLPGLRPDAPLLYVVHGGGWDSGDATELFCYPSLTRMLRESGWALASVEYRLTDTPDNAHFDEMFEDILDGLAWLADRCDQFCFDPGRVAVIGTSAGGHLALMTGLAGKAFRPGLPADIRLVIDCCGPADLLDFGALEGEDFAYYLDAIEKLAGAPPTAPQAAVYRRISPYAYITPQSPPIFMLHGTADTIVPFGHSQKIAERCLAQGVPHCLMPLTHAWHDMELSKLPGLQPQPGRDAALRCAAAWAIAYTD